MSGPLTPFSQQLHAQKYRGPGESFEEAMSRVAGALTREEPGQYQALRGMLLGMRFMPAGRIQAAMGAAKRVTPYNCYVSGRIEDSFVEGAGSIMERASQAAATMRMGGGIGYDFSTLRPRGDTIRKLGSRSSGPVSFMDIFDAICRCVASSGHRRGAQMGVLRVDHPDIEEFVRAKQAQGRLTGFNVSVAVTDEFMEAVAQDLEFSLRFDGEHYRHVHARSLWDTIMRSTWDWAEPGVLFVDTINRRNNLWYCEQIAATNPCGEQPLPPFGACLLGSFNLVRYVDIGRTFDQDLLRQDVWTAVRAMDRVIDEAVYPLPEQEREAKRKRRMGLGVTGLANAAEHVAGRACYGEQEFLDFERMVLETIRDAAYRASAQLAVERGPFRHFEAEPYLAGEFAMTLPGDVRDKIAESGIRNSHLLSIAPTGTISLCADNVSSGIEPVFDYEVERAVQSFEGTVVHRLRDYGSSVLGVRGRRFDEVTPEQHLRVLSVASGLVDSAVSKTINVPRDVAWESFKDTYMQAWMNGCKGCTTFRVGGQRQGVLERASEDADGKACSVDPSSGKRDCE